MTRSAYKVLALSFFGILLLFLLSVPVFYFIIDGTQAKIISDNGLWYVAARALRFLLAGGLCCLIRRKNKAILLEDKALGKKVLAAFGAAICLCLILHFHGFSAHLYGTVSNMIGVYTNTESHLFLSVLWEQLFAGDLLWSLLLFLPILFLSRPAAKARAQEQPL